MEPIDPETMVFEVTPKAQMIATDLRIPGLHLIDRVE